MKDVKIDKLQRKRDHWRHEEHKNETDENCRTYSESRNQIKKAVKKKRKPNSKEKFDLKKRAKKFGR